MPLASASPLPKQHHIHETNIGMMPCFSLPDGMKQNPKFLLLMRIQYEACASGRKHLNTRNVRGNSASTSKRRNQSHQSQHDCTRPGPPSTSETFDTISIDFQKLMLSMHTQSLLAKIFVTCLKNAKQSQADCQENIHSPARERCAPNSDPMNPFL